MRRLSAIALLVTLPHAAIADAPARPLVRHLGSALADETGRVPILAEIPDGESAASLGMREIAPGIGAVRLAPADVEAFGQEYPDLALFAGPPKRVLLDVSVPATGAPVFRKRTGSNGAGAIVGIVDTGVDLTHPAFRDASGHTRVAWLLTWGDPQGKHPDVEDAMGCTDPKLSPCAVYSADDINAMLDANATFPDDMHDLVGHGTHVASIAAGNGRTRSSKVAPVYVGMAPEAQLVVAAPSRSGGFPDDEILRGAKFVFDRADSMGLPIAVNLSLGGDFGPHDGTSPLEKGLAAYVGPTHPGHAIVVASGNSGGLYEVKATDGSTIKPIGAHTTVHVDDHAPVSVPVITPQATSGKVFVWITFRQGDFVKVGLHGPDGRWISPVAPGNDAGHDAGNNTNGSVINNEVNGLSMLTKDTNGAVVAWAGTWQPGAFTIDLEGHGDAELWVVGEGAVAATGAYFERGMVEGTVATPASSPSLLAVGCTVNRTMWPTAAGGFVQLQTDMSPGDICFFSAAGPTPTGVPKPEILAPGGFIVGAMSVDADPRTHPGSIFDVGGCPPDAVNCYVVNDGYAVTSGTSMSSPHAAGAVALLLDHKPSLTQPQITDILQASAQVPKGAQPYQSQLGPGAIDLSQALDVMAAEPTMGTPPDVQRSWWTLSSELARPDPTYAITGTIELRHSDGTVVSGLDGSKLTIIADGGVLQSPPAKVRYGLFRFAVAGDKGSAGKTMHVRVLYDGVPIGAAKDVAIEVDNWITASAPATGGTCSIGNDGGREPLFVVAILVAGLTARRSISGARVARSRARSRLRA